MKDSLKKLEESVKEKGKKRNGNIEKNQLKLLQETFKKTRRFFADEGIEIDTSRIKHMRKKENLLYIDTDGVLRSAADDGPTHEKDPVNDSKYFDAIVPVNVRGHNSVILCMLKGVQDVGGSQNDSMREMATLSKYLIPKNQDKNVHFLFQFDGEYAKQCIKYFKESDKTTVTDSIGINTAIVNIISKFIEEAKEM